MYFECHDEELGETYLTKLPFYKGIFVLLFGKNYATYIPWWKIIKNKNKQ